MTDTGELREDWLRRSGSVVLPEESALHFDDDQCSRFATAFDLHGVEELFAVPLENDDSLDAFELGTGTDELRALSFECGSFSYLLMPDGEPNLAVHCTIDDYFVVAGPCSFVKAFAGDLALAERNFFEFVNAHFEVAKPRLIPGIRYWLGEWSAISCDQGFRGSQQLPQEPFTP